MNDNEKAEFNLWLDHHGLPRLSPAELLASKTIRLDTYQLALITKIAEETGELAPGPRATGNRGRVNRHRWVARTSFQAVPIVIHQCSLCGLLRETLPSRIRRGRLSTEWTYRHASGPSRTAGGCPGPKGAQS